VALVRVARHEELAEVVPRTIASLPGITGTRTFIAFEAFSRRDLEAMWSVGVEEAQGPRPLSRAPAGEVTDLKGGEVGKGGPRSGGGRAK